MMKIMITAFDPFGDDTINPAQEVMNRLPDIYQTSQIIKVLMPTVFHKSASYIEEALKQHQPDYLLSIGQAGGRSAISIERVAINLDDARIPDNDNNRPIDVMIQQTGAPAYFSQLPIKAMLSKVNEKEIPAEISNSAGTFVCNHVMYQSLFLTNTKYFNTKAGFVHIPFLPSQVLNRPQYPSMSLDDMVVGILACIEAMILFYDCEDLKLVGGKTH